MLKQFSTLLAILALAAFVHGQTPVLTGLTPPSMLAGAGATTLTLHGTGFMAMSTVRIGARSLTPSSLTSTQIQVLVRIGRAHV